MRPCPHGIPDPSLCDICEVMKAAKQTDLRKKPARVGETTDQDKFKIDEAGNVGWLIP